MKSLKQIQTEIGQWAKGQFGENISKDEAHPSYGSPLGSIAPLLGVGEEYGELLHPVLYRLQGRGCEGQEGRDMMEDAVADLMVFLCDFASREGIDLEATLNKVWEKVSKRTQAKWLEDKAKERDGKSMQVALPDGQVVCPKCKGSGETMYGSLASVCPVCEGKKLVSPELAANVALDS